MNDRDAIAVLKMQQVVKLFQGHLALSRLNFELPEGKVVGLLGRNGAGKTTLIECALGLKDVSAGSITLFDEPPGAFSEATRARIGYVPQQTDLFEWMTAPQMLAFFKAFYPRWNDDKVDALLSRWSISTNTQIGKLSGGEKQRLAIIRALAPEPDVLILDEPVASLDPSGRRDFLREIVDTVLTRHATVLFSTHILTDLTRVADDVAIMRQGKILLHEALDTLTEETVILSGASENLATFAPYLLTPLVNSGADTKRVAARLSQAMQASLAAAHLGVSITPILLEDFFIEVTS